MAESPRRRYSESPVRHYRSRSRSRSYSPSRQSYRSRSRSPGGSPGDNPDSYNPGNNLYVTGLSTRVTERDLEEFFSREGRVAECRLVVDPRTKASRGFGFVTMDTTENAEHCVKYLNRSILDGRVITVEKAIKVRARRKRARTPTPGRYLGVKSARETSYRSRRPYESSYRDGARRRSPRYSPRYSPYDRRDYTPDRDRSPRGRDGARDRSRSPDYSPYNGSKPRAYRSGSPYRSRTRSRSASASPRPR